MRFRQWMPVVSVLILPLPSTLAQTKPIDSLQEVTVTARKREEPLQSVPSSVSVLTDLSIARRDLRSAIDLTATAPNLQTAVNPVVFNAPTFHIRGVGQGDHNWNTENGVAVFVDDVYLQSTSAAWIDMLDIERVEILRGPQGSLYGRNSTSGAIKFVPRRPDPSARGGYAQVTIGSHSRVDIKTGVSLPLEVGRTAFKIDAFRVADHGYLTQVDLSNRALDNSLGRREHVGVRVATIWRPSDSLEFELNGDVSRQDNGMNIVSPIVPEDPAGRNDLTQLLSKRGTVKFVPLYGANRAALETLTAGGSSGQHAEGVVFKGALDGATGRLRSVTAWRRSREHFVSQLGGRGTPSTIFGVTLYGNVNTDYQSVDQFSQELQFAGHVGSSLDVTLGAFYFNSDWDESEYGATNGVPANFSPFTMPGQSQAFGGSYNDIDQSTQSWALYANIDWRLGKRVTLSAGARQTWDDKRLFFNTLFEDHVNVYPGFPVNTRNSWNRLTPRFGIVWQPSERLLMYVNAEKGYKAGNIEGARSSVAATAGRWLAPELANSLEAGIKAESPQHRLRTNIAVFTSKHTGRTDLISPDLVASSDVRYEGIEAELTWRPVSGLELFANLGLLRARYLAVSANHPILASDPTGYAPGYEADPPVTPRHTLSLGGQYEFAVGAGQSIALSASLRAVARHFHALGLNNFDSERVDAYEIVDTSASWTSSSNRLQLTVGAHNLLDDEYYVNGLFGAIPEFAGRYYADRRTVYFTMSTRW